MADKNRTPEQQARGTIDAMLEQAGWTVYGRPANEADRQVTGQVTGQVTDPVEQLVAALAGEMSRAQIQVALQLKDRHNLTTVYLKPALEAGLIEMTLPGKPTSRNQRHRRTVAGEALARQTMGKDSSV